MIERCGDRVASLGQVYLVRLKVVNLKASIAIPMPAISVAVVSARAATREGLDALYFLDLVCDVRA